MNAHFVQKYHQLAFDSGLLSCVFHINDNSIRVFDHIFQQQGQESSKHQLHSGSTGSPLLTQTP